MTAITVAAGCAVGGCFSKDDDAETSPSAVTENRNVALSAIVAIDNGCTAVKVGPKHLLLAARCVANKPAYAIGKTLRFAQATALLNGQRAADAGPAPVVDARADAVPSAADATTNANPQDAAAQADASSSSDAGAAPAPTDAGSPGADAGVSTDGGVSPNSNNNNTNGNASSLLREGLIAQVQIHPSYLQKCGTGVCAPGLAGSADVADVAVIVLGAEIAEIPVAPIDLDPIGVGEHVLLVGYGCGERASSAAIAPRASETIIAKTDIVTHDGSPYRMAPDLIPLLGRSYLVTRGPGLRENNNEELPGVCSDRDFGAPLLRANASAVVGVSSNFTAASPAARVTPSTNAHTRLDTGSRYQIGQWLSAIGGVKTTSTCAGSDAGCPDGGFGEPGDLHEGDASSEGGGSTYPGSTETPALPEDDGTSGSTDKPRPNPEPVNPKAKGPSSAGCSTSPTTSGNGGWSFASYFAAAALILAARRRRR